VVFWSQTILSGRASAADLCGWRNAMRFRAIYFSRDFVDAGGLMGYGPNLVDAYRIALAEQAERIDEKFPPRKEGRK
jgi:hypothetical protein